MSSSFSRLLFGLGALALVGVGYGLWYASIANLSSTVASLDAQIEANTALSGRIAAARTTLADIKGDEAVVQAYFVPSSGVVGFITELETLARGLTATLKVLSVSTGNDPDHPTLVLSVAIDGTFDAVMRTVGAIEFAPYDLTVPKFTINKDEKTLWHATLDLVVGSVKSPTP